MPSLTLLVGVVWITGAVAD